MISRSSIAPKRKRNGGIPIARRESETEVAVVCA